MATPLATVKERFGSKSDLVAAVEKFTKDDLWVSRLSSDRNGRGGIKNISNAKLLRLHEAFTKAKEEFGSRAKLIDAILELDPKGRSPEYRRAFEDKSVLVLLGIQRELAKARKKVKAGA